MLPLTSRAVVGGHKEAVVALAQRGAAVDATGVPHEEEEHLERPLLTAAQRGNCDMMRLLVQVRRLFCEAWAHGCGRADAAADARRCSRKRQAGAAWAACSCASLGAQPLACAGPTTQLGASLDAPSPCGYTPLSVALCWEQPEATRLLLQLGADPNQVRG